MNHYQYASSVPSIQALIPLFIICFGQDPIKSEFFLVFNKTMWNVKIFESKTFNFSCVVISDYKNSVL